MVTVGAVADGEIIETPAGIATDSAAAMVAPEQWAPTIPTTFEILITLVAASVAFWGLQPESPVTVSIWVPSLNKPPCSLTWLKAIWADLIIAGAIAAMGPEIPPSKPTFTFSEAKELLAEKDKNAIVQRVSVFLFILTP